MSVFEQMKIHKHELQSVHAPLCGFTSDAIHPVGSITLPLIVGDAPHQATVMVNFLVVDCPSAYNVILGRTTLNNLCAITSTRCLKMKFPIKNDVDVARGDQLTAHKCYDISTKDEVRAKQTLLVEEVDIRNEKHLHQAELGKANPRVLAVAKHARSQSPCEQISTSRYPNVDLRFLTKERSRVRMVT